MISKLMDNIQKDNKHMNIFCPLLGAFFIGLKLTGYIAWSWWFVTAPIWLPVVIVLVIMLGVFTTILTK